MRRGDIVWGVIGFTITAMIIGVIFFIVGRGDAVSDALVTVKKIETIEVQVDRTKEMSRACFGLGGKVLLNEHNVYIGCTLDRLPEQWVEIREPPTRKPKR